MTREFYKRGLFFFILAIIIIPFVQEQFVLFNIKKVEGYYTPAEKETFSFKAWFNGSWQNSMESYVNENIGFRPVFVRVQNQILYSIFKKSSNSNIIIGKDRVLYQIPNLYSYFGKDFKGTVVFEKQFKKLKKIQRILKERGTNLLVLIAPDKASIYPEYIPDRFKNEKQDSTNYEVWVKELDKYQIDYIDFNQLFKTLKTKAKYPLYPKSGYHWSCYSFGIAADSLFSYIRKRYEYELPQFKFLPGEETSTNFRYTDNDLAKLLNVYYSSPEWKLYYPEIEFINSLEDYKPNVLVIGDSYMQSFFGFYPFYDRIFSQNSLLWVCYLDEIWPTLVRNIDKSQLTSIIASKDLIILEATDVNNWNFAYGFINDAYYFLTTEGFDYNTAVNNYMNSIRNSPDWSESTRLQAKQDNVTYEEMVKRNAIWMVQQEINNKP